MTIANRVDIDMSHWAPITRLYEVDGGHLAVTVSSFLNSVGTYVYYCDGLGVAVGQTMQPIAQYPHGTTHNEALENLGYTVLDNVSEPISSVEEDIVEAAEQSVFELLPPEISQMLLNSKKDQI